MTNIKEIIFMSTGLTAVFDKNGQQIAELQESWFRLYLKFLKEKGISLKQIEETQINTPGGSLKYISKHDNWKYS